MTKKALILSKVAVFAILFMTFPALAYGVESATGTQPSASTTPTPSAQRAMPQEKTPQQRTMTGKVTALNAPKFTMTVRDINYTVDATNAKILRRYGDRIQLSEFQVGDIVKVTGTVDGTNVTAKIVRNESLQIKNTTFVGNVKSLGTNSFVINIPFVESKIVGSKNGQEQREYNVNITNSTQFTKNKQPATFADLKVGSNVAVYGAWNLTRRNVTAEKVNIIVKLIHVRIKGTLAAKTENTLTVTGDDSKTYTVNAANAAIRQERKGKLNISALNVGDKLEIQGQRSAEESANAITARQIKVLKSILDSEDKEQSDKDRKDQMKDKKKEIRAEKKDTNEKIKDLKKDQKQMRNERLKRDNPGGGQSGRGQ